MRLTKPTMLLSFPREISRRSTAPDSIGAVLGVAGADCVHVLDIDLGQASDSTIWRYAEESRAIVISKDEDFLHLALRNAGSARLIWVRIGNCRKGALLSRFHELWPQILERLNEGEQILEIR